MPANWVISGRGAQSATRNAEPLAGRARGARPSVARWAGRPQGATDQGANEPGGGKGLLEAVGIAPAPSALAPASERATRAPLGRPPRQKERATRGIRSLTPLFRHNLIKALTLFRHYPYKHDHPNYREISLVGSRKFRIFAS
jgi:hypothetical protein